VGGGSFGRDKDSGLAFRVFRRYPAIDGADRRRANRFGKRAFIMSALLT
jgi:hypothetical protein